MKPSLHNIRQLKELDNALNNFKCSKMKNREIKFRAWLPAVGIMLPDVTVYSNGQIGIGYDALSDLLGDDLGIDDDYIKRASQDGQEIIPILTGDEWVYIESPHAHIGQFTGLLDKNGKGIYEGDVLNYKRHKEENNWASEMVFDKNYEIEVVFNKGMFIAKGLDAPLYEYIKDNTYGATGTKWEVIGNIHETPELLK